MVESIQRVARQAEAHEHVRFPLDPRTRKTAGARTHGRAGGCVRVTRVQACGCVLCARVRSGVRVRVWRRFSTLGPFPLRLTRSARLRLGGHPLPHLRASNALGLAAIRHAVAPLNV